MAIFSPIQEPTRNDQISVGLTAVKISDARNDVNPRKTILIRNISPNATDIITINLGNSSPVANSGIVLRQYESFTDTQDAGYSPNQGSITAICATATGLLSVMER